jgi:hypothetical protein
MKPRMKIHQHGNILMAQNIKEPQRSAEHYKGSCTFCKKEVLIYPDTAAGISLSVDLEKVWLISEKGRIMNGRSIHSCKKYWNVLAKHFGWE